MSRFGTPDGGTRFVTPDGGSRFGTPDGGMRFGTPAVLLALASAACGGGNANVKAAGGARGELASPLVAAMRDEANGDPLAAKKSYLAVVDAAIGTAVCSG